MPRRVRRWGIFFPAAALALFGLTSCVRDALREDLAEHQREHIATSAELRRDIAQGGGRKLDWETALRLMGERNLSLIRARQRLEETRERRDEQWKTWVPRLSAYSNLQTSLSQLGNLSSSNLSTSIIAPLSIPNPLTERARAFRNALSYLQAEDNYALTYRRQVTTLYSLFSRYERTLESAPPALDEIQPGPGAIANALGAVQQEKSLENSLQQIRTRLSQVLNLPGESPVPIPSTRPDIDYSDKIDDFVPGKNYAQLAVRISAYQIQAAILQEKGVKIRQLPFVNFNASSPALYDSRREDTIDPFNSERIFLFGGLTKSFDLANTDAERIETAEENTAMVRANLLLRLDDEAREWLRLKERYRELEIKSNLAKERLAMIVERSSEGSALSELEVYRNTINELEQIEETRENLNLEVWIWDGSRW